MDTCHMRWLQPTYRAVLVLAFAAQVPLRQFASETLCLAGGRTLMGRAVHLLWYADAKLEPEECLGRPDVCNRCPQLACPVGRWWLYKVVQVELDTGVIHVRNSEHGVGGWAARLLVVLATGYSGLICLLSKLHLDVLVPGCDCIVFSNRVTYGSCLTTELAASMTVLSSRRLSMTKRSGTSWHWVCASCTGASWHPTTPATATPP